MNIHVMMYVNRVSIVNRTVELLPSNVADLDKTQGVMFIYLFKCWSHGEIRASANLMSSRSTNAIVSDFDVIKIVLLSLCFLFQCQPV